jgi:hypothetical protein
VRAWRDGVYVDPEDWSSHRTRYLPPIARAASSRSRSAHPALLALASLGLRLRRAR